MTPVIRALKKREPDCRVDCVVYDRFSAALACHPDLNRLLLVPKKELKADLFQGRYSSFIRKLNLFIKELRTVQYDYVIDLHNVTDSALVALLARGRIKVGHKKQILSLFFPVRSAFDIGFASSRVHAAEANLRFLVDAGCLDESDIPQKPRLEFFGPPSAPSEIDTYFQEQNLLDKQLVGINPCASYDFKRWNAEGFAAVADYLVETYNCTILLFGSPNERPVVQQVMSAMHTPAIDTSSLSLFQAFELIGRLQLFVTNDSAPMHIAAALGTPLVAIHGPINVKKFYPLTDRARSISKDLPCLPCKDIATCRSRLCFDLVTVEEVCQACDELLASGADQHP
jgi:lipopolysaccharide heptosyltransferase II